MPILVIFLFIFAAVILPGFKFNVIMKLNEFIDFVRSLEFQSNYQSEIISFSDTRICILGTSNRLAVLYQVIDTFLPDFAAVFGSLDSDNKPCLYVSYLDLSIKNGD